MRLLKSDFILKDKYIDEKEINIDKEYRNFSKKEQNECSEIYNFCSFSYLYKKSFFVRQDLIKIEKLTQTIKDGGFAYSADGTKYFAEHKNLIDYVISNGILIEDYLEFQAINKTYVEIAFNRRMQSSEINLEKYELFSCIKYFSKEELYLFFNRFINIENKSKKLKFSEENITWLVDISLHNCIKDFTNKNNVSSRHERFIVNILFILSFVEIPDNMKSNIIKEIKILINKARNTFGLFDAINYFFGLQYNLFQSIFPAEDIMSIIETLLIKYIHGQVNIYEHDAITQNKLSNLFGHIYFLKFEFNNLKLLDSFLLRVKLNDENIHDLTYIAQYILLAIYFAADEACKLKIKEFIITVKDKKNDDTEGKLIFLLTLLQAKILNNYEDIAKQLEVHLKQQKEGNIFSSRFFVLQKQIESISKEHSEFKQSLNLINELLERYNSNKPPSYI